MKSTGMVKRIDELGRIVLPKNVRQPMGIDTGDSVEIFTDGDRIILKKFQSSCIFCGEADGVIFFNEKRVCKACLEKLKTL
ncbi:MAG: AbrB/MazE/SpoVT family DNA-binding domain-containing protein [Clostridia bacterium]|nr:AbrB/MazE/SpoVT family DNA-binding domain-containing protein [Clostridia bacterium]